MKWLFSLLALIAAACGPLPRDPEGTLDRVRAERSFRVGIIGPVDDPASLALIARYVGRVARATGARPEMVEGASEPLLTDVEAGKVDLVIGLLAPDTPWIDRVALVQPLGETVRPRHLLVTPAARSGENAWIMLLEREARAIAAERAAP